MVEVVISKNKSLNQEELLFNIIYIPGMTKYLEPFVSSLLKSTTCKYRLIANGCFPDEELLLEEYCNKSSRLEFLLLSSDKILTHCKALSILQKKEKSDYFCFMDADIFSDGSFLDELLPYLDKYSGVFSAYPIWCDSKYQVISKNWPDMGGRHIVSSDGKCLGGSYFALYDNKALRTFIDETDISFDRYTWDQIPPQYQNELEALGMNKSSYDTGKVLNILFQERGNPLVFVEVDSLFHLGAMTEFFTGKTSRLFNGKSFRFLKRRFLKYWTLLKKIIKKVLGVDNSSLTDAQSSSYEKMLETRAIVSNYFLELLLALSNNRSFNQKLSLSNPVIERRVEAAAQEMKEIWRNNTFK